MARHTSDEERRAFLSEGTRTAKLAVTRKTGASHVAPIWFVSDGDDIIFTTGQDTVKASPSCATAGSHSRSTTRPRRIRSSYSAAISDEN